MRSRFIQAKDGSLVPAEDFDYSTNAPMVMPDIPEYTSMIDGSRITSRSQHRQHLRQHGCVEVGNDIDLTPRQAPDVDPKGRKELIVSQIYAMGHEGFKRALKKDIDFIKWNSRED